MGSTVGSYVALGDSFTAGNGISEGSRWPDLLAADLGAGREDFSYLNLARDGADSRAVAETVDVAVALRPDLVTLICGANDVLLTPRPDIPAFGERFDRMLSRLRREVPGVRVLVSTYPEGWDLPGIGPRTRQRIDGGIRDLNRTILDVAAANSVPCMDVVSHPGAREAGNIDRDGLHPSEQGHQRAAVEFAATLERHFGISPNNRRITA